MIPKDENGKFKYAGEQLFEHMCKFRNIQMAAKTKQGQKLVIEPSAGLDIHIHPDAMGCIIPTDCELRQGDVLQDAVGEEMERKCASRKLTNLGTVVGQ